MGWRRKIFEVFTVFLLKTHTLESLTLTTQKWATARDRAEATHIHHEVDPGGAGPSRATGSFLNILTSEESLQSCGAGSRERARVGFAVRRARGPPPVLC